MYRVDKDEYEVILEQTSPGEAPPATVAVSLYNYEGCISECLLSAESQTLQRLDLVVVDDHSTDHSAEVATVWLRAHLDRFDRALIARSRHNRGLAGTRNTAFALARTEYVFVLDADNTLYPRCLERLCAALRNCSASFAYCYLEKFGDTTALLNTKAWDPANLRNGNSIDAMVLHRRKFLDQVGGYSEDMPVMGWEDFDLWFKIARAGGWGVLVPEILARYRVHRSSLLNVVTNPNTAKLWSYLRSRHPEFFT